MNLVLLAAGLIVTGLFVATMMAELILARIVPDCPGPGSRPRTVTYVDRNGKTVTITVWDPCPTCGKRH